MKRQIKIAVFGLSLNILEAIKIEIRALHPNFNIGWANIHDPELNILLVNEIFFHSAKIQELVTVKNIPYLRLILNEAQSGLIFKDILYLPFVGSSFVKEWFQHHLNAQPEFTKTDRIEYPFQKKQDLEKVIQAFFNERNDNIQIFDGLGTIGLMNTRTEQVWLDSERKIKGIDQSLNYAYATMQMARSVSNQQGLDLKTWLWNALWFSSSLFKAPSKSKSYKLEFWPQPDAIASRTEIFQIAACFEKGASIEQIEQSLDIAPEVISKFVAVSLMSQALREIPAIEACFYVNKAVEATRGWGQYFSRFRTKFGI